MTEPAFAIKRQVACLVGVQIDVLLQAVMIESPRTQWVSRTVGEDSPPCIPNWRQPKGISSTGSMTLKKHLNQRLRGPIHRPRHSRLERQRVIATQ